jgi:hypothetical protein
MPTNNYADSPIVLKVFGDAGPRGPSGNNISFRGVLSAVEDLDSVVSPDDGHAYIIGLNIYVYDSILGWVNGGQIRPTVTIDPVTVLNPDQDPSVSEGSDTFNATFTFSLPRSADVSVGTVSTVPFNTSASVSDSGTNGDVVLDFSLPMGKPFQILGVLASTGDLPASGDVADTYVINNDLYIWDGSSWVNAGTFVGPGVASGGTADQVLFKVSGTDYDTEWRTLAIDGGDPTTSF